MPGVSRLAADSLGACVMAALLTLALMPESEVAAQNASGARANAAPQDPAGEWHMQARDFANTRYSPLDQINLDTVKRLRVAWTFSDGAAYGHEGAPLVIGSMMYVVARWMICLATRSPTASRWGQGQGRSSLRCRRLRLDCRDRKASRTVPPARAGSPCTPEWTLRRMSARSSNGCAAM